jgi:hypothetical protein
MVLFFHAIDPWWDLFSCLPMAGEKNMVGEPNCPIHDPNSCQTSELVDGGPFSSIVLA